MITAQEQSQKQVYVIGQVIGYFLKRLDLPESIKYDLSVLIPNLSIEQLKFFCKFLEKSYCDQGALKKIEGYQELREEKTKQLIISFDNFIKTQDIKSL